jgi:diguanylate cyclase (GGDEF)-like protein/PAS domain S-box-containing protein
VFPVEISGTHFEESGKKFSLSVVRDVSDRKQAEAKLQDSHNFLDLIINSISDAIAVKDRQHRWVQMNDAFCAMIGEPREVLLGKSDCDFFPKEQADGFRKNDELIFASGEADIDEEILTSTHGEVRYIQTKKTPFRGADGQMRLVAASRDITEIRQVQLALQKREDELSSLLANLPDNIIRWDTEGRYLYINPVHAHTLGASADALIGTLIPDSHEQVKAAIAQVAATGQVVQIVKQAVPVNGITEIHEVSVMPEFDEAGRVISVLGIGRNMTEMYRMQEALAAREQEFRTLAENIPDTLIRYDREGRRTYINSVLKQIYAVREEQMIGLTQQESNPFIMPESYRLALEHTLATGERSELELPIPTPSGDMTNLIIIVAERASDGQISGAITIGRDITERKRMELDISTREREFRSLVENLPDNIVRHDREGRATYICPRLEITMGAVASAGMIGTTVRGNMPDGSFEDYAQLLDAVLASGEIGEIEKQMPGPDGTLSRVHQLRMVPEYGENGTMIGVLSIGRDITEQKQAEKRLSLLSYSLESVRDAAYLVDKSGRITYANLASGKMLGYLPDEFLGLMLFDIVPDISPENWAVHWQRILASGGNALIETSNRTKDGRIIPVEVGINIIECDGEEFNIAMVRDITERKRIETMQKDSHYALKEAQRIGQIGSWDLDIANDALTWSDETFSIWEINKNRFAATFEAFLNTVHPDDRDSVVNAYNESLSNHTRYEVEHRLLFPDGRIKYIRQRGEPYFDAHGKPLRFLGTSLDITERKRLENELTQREREFRTLVENSVDTVARFGKDRRRLYANPALASRVEGGLAAVLGKTPTEAPGGPGAQAYKEKLGEVFATGQVTEFEVMWLGKGGQEICSLINLTPEFGKDGEVETVLAVGRDISELYAHRQKIHQMAFYDGLTSLPNRALFNDRLRQMITDVSWHGQSAGVMMIDLDRFKTVNDTMGHAVGDELLRKVATRLNSCVRAYDTVARLGGDEFAILLPDMRTSDDLGSIANKILGEFSECFVLDGKEVFTSCSIGIALYPNDSCDAQDLLKFSDSAMYLAKRSGRNNFRFYSAELTASAQAHLALESELRRAMERHEFELHYQPKISLRDGLVMGSEALLRWRSPTRGMVPPGDFIQIAEDTGLIVEIGKWVLGEACRTAAQWNAGGKPMHKVAINLSARQFQNCDLVATVTRALEESACSAQWVELEITESLLLDEDGRVLETLHAFRAMGISIAIDDFGTGYSSLSYLARFPIDTLKIDRSFVNTVTTDNYHAELVRAVLSIARSLGQQVVAEGVETAEQAAFLEAHRCQLAQGFLYSKALPKHAFELFIESTVKFH